MLRGLAADQPAGVLVITESVAVQVHEAWDESLICVPDMCSSEGARSIRRVIS